VVAIFTNEEKDIHGCYPAATFDVR
jgi:hypothetical protein